MAELVALLTEEAPKNDDDNFAAAFAQITEADNASTVAEAKPAATTVETPAVAAEETTPALTAEETAAAAAAEAAKVAPVVEAKPTVSDDDLVKRLGKLLGNTETPVAEVIQEQTPAAPVFKQDEMAFLDSYVKEYPDIARAEGLIRRGEYQSVVGYIFSEVKREFAPMIETLRTLSERTHLGDIQAAVPDYNATRENVIGWIEKQPSYLRAAYEHVVKAGTVDDVADLIRRYKVENPAPAVAEGTTVAQAAAATVAKPAQAAVVAAKPAVVELSAAAKKAAAALAPVNSKISNRAVVDDPSDFDTAFAMAAKAL